MWGLHIHGFIHIIIMYIGSYMYASTQIRVCLSDTNRSYLYARGHRCRLWGQPEHTFPPANRRTSMHLSVFNTFFPSKFGFVPNIFDKSTPVCMDACIPVCKCVHIRMHTLAD